MRSVFFLPVFLFVVSQIVSICGAFDALSAFDDDGINDMSLEDIVFIDPFLRSIENHQLSKHQAGLYLADRQALRAVHEILSACFCTAIEIDTPRVFVAAIENRLTPAPNLWLSNRVLRI